MASLHRALLALLLLPAPVAAEDHPLDSNCYRYAVDPPAEPHFDPKCRVIGETMYIDGEIGDFMWWELRTFYPQVRRLELNSGGGIPGELAEMVAYVRARGMTTNVRKGARCMSACTLLYMAGTRRTAHRSAKFMFHGFNNQRTDFDAVYREICARDGEAACRANLEARVKDSVARTTALFERYVQLGASPELWLRYQAYDEDPDWFKHANFFKKKDWVMYAPEAAALGVVQEIVED
ncbi:MAG: hypothetical protein HY078_09215 [Elusimicrobia bacterium]|nr:hypothetical protein [Elusimicrobiota bacterium]